MATLFEYSLQYDGATIFRRAKLDDFVRNSQKAEAGDVKLLVQRVPDSEFSQHSEGLFACAAFCEKTTQKPHWHGDAREVFIVLKGELRVAWARPGNADAHVEVETLYEGDSVVVERGCCHVVGLSQDSLALTFKARPDLVVDADGGVGKADCGEKKSLNCEDRSCGHSAQVREQFEAAVRFHEPGET